MGITYCSHTDCYYRDCTRHQSNAPKDRDISIADLNDGYCFIPESLVTTKHRHKKERLTSAICRGTQSTNYKCDNPTKAMCDADGSCYYCAAIADAIEEEFKYLNGEAFWIDVTKPGQITCGGNPVYACSRCGNVYGSYELFPSAKYCAKCGARLKMKVVESE
jgi:hypothetical protein